MNWKFRVSALLLLVCLAACGDKDAVEIIDLRSDLEVTLLNYQSTAFSVPEDIPLNQDLGASRTLSFSTRTEPIQLSLERRGLDFAEIKKALFSLRMELEPQNYEGTAEIRIYVSPLFDVYSHNEAVRITKREILPAMFDFSGEDLRLNSYLLLDYFYLGFEFILEPSRVSDRHIGIAGRIEEFELTVTGSRTLRQSYY